VNPGSKTIALLILLIVRCAWGGQVTIPGTSDMWLAGMPDGTAASCSPCDYAPNHSPVLVPVTIVSGQSYSFTASGLVAQDLYFPFYGPEGNINALTTHWAIDEHGKSDIYAPTDSLIGVFLDSSLPSSSPAPSRLDFDTALSRNFTTLSPLLKQTFFIGDGNTDSRKKQYFIAPPGATRLLLGTMDSHEWSNNRGSFEVNITPTTVLVYDDGGTRIQSAMSLIGITYDLRTPSAPVTLSDLASHDILIVGGNVFDMNGITPSVLYSGITGNILLTGQDPDFHISYVAARKFFTQAISFVRSSNGTGLLALADFQSAYTYLPPQWGISATGHIALENISSFTADGLAAGIFNGLTPADMSYWLASYHTRFNSWGPQFLPFELGNSNRDVVTIGTAPQSEITFTKTSNINEGDCVVPDQEIDYSINYTYIGAGDTNVTITDYLPVEVDYNSSSPSGVYNAIDRTVTWNIGTIPPDGNGTLTVKCFVNYSAEPCGVFTNTCLISGDSTDAVAEVNTAVCYWNQIIYVDHNAAGLNNGLTWEHAYVSLQNALDRAEAEGHSEIWVAKGTYKPSAADPCGPAGVYTFKLIKDTPIYGHFSGNELSISERDFNDQNNITILSGENAGAYYIITASGFSQHNIVDGFTIEKATLTPSSAFRINNAYLSISNCKINQNRFYGINLTNSVLDISDSVLGYNESGIYDSNSSFTINNCVFQNNSQYGIYADFANNLNLAKSKIENSLVQTSNNNDGIYIYRANSPVEIANSLIHHNGKLSNFTGGIRLEQSPSLPAICGCEIYGNGHSAIYTSQSTADIHDNYLYGQKIGIYIYNSGQLYIHNNTISGNNNYGIRRDYGTTPVINNCILWNNSDDLYNCNATYSCIDDNDPGIGNIDDDPCFINADANDFHLRFDSNCIDAGDPNFNDFNEIDYDGEFRIMFGKSSLRVDMGADEVYWPKADFDRNRIVNFIDYSYLANTWQTINQDESLDCDNDVDIQDLCQFGKDWLWQAP